MAIYSKNYKDNWNLRDQVTYSSEKNVTYLKQYSYFFGIVVLYS